MMRFRFVLCATDLSSEGAVAVKTAAAMAEGHGARLGALLVLPRPLAFHPLDPQRHVPDYAQTPGAEAEALDALRTHVSGNLPAEQRGPDLWVEHGIPHAVIVERAEALGADLLVVGAHRRSALKTAVLGSVVDRTLRHAHCSTLVAREGRAGHAVVAATDFSDAAARAVSVAAEEAKRLGARLKLVHSIGPMVNVLVPAVAVPSAMAASGAVTAEDLSAVRRDAEGWLDHARARVGGDADLVVTDGEPAADIVHTAEREAATLIVLGSVGRTGLARMLLGSVAEDVVRSARCPVLVVR